MKTALFCPREQREQIPIGRFLRGVGVLFGLLVILNLAVCLLVEFRPLRSATIDRMGTIKHHILQYARTNNKLPENLNALPRSPGHSDEIVDLWRNPIRFCVEGNCVTLMSFGSDGKAGGKGDAADIVGRFESKRQEGTWSDEFESWRDDPSKRYRDAITSGDAASTE